MKSLRSELRRKAKRWPAKIKRAKGDFAISDRGGLLIRHHGKWTLIPNHWFDALYGQRKAIIFERFGLYDGKPKALEACARSLGISRQRVRELQVIALSNLRDHLKRAERLVEEESLG